MIEQPRIANRHIQTHPRRGVALILVLIFLGLTGTFAAGWIVAANASTDHLRLWENRSQARALAESALDRAAAALRKDENHSGDQWTLPAEEFAGRFMANVKTVVHKPENSSRARAIETVVELRADDQTLVRASKRITLDLPAEEESL